MSINKFTAMTGGKYGDFKKEEYSIMLTRVESINQTLTQKCASISLIPLGKHFSFGFEFHGISSYLKKIEDFDKKARKDPLKKWWMNQKASEMASNYLPEILDQLDKVALQISKQEKSELLQNKFQKYIQLELLECAIECKFCRPRTATSNIFPNTSFQYARSRLRKKLENIYFNETELTCMTTNQKKKKDEWIKMIKTKKAKCKRDYFVEKTKKQKQKKKHKRMKKQLKKQEVNSNNKMPFLHAKVSNSMSVSTSMSKSITSTVCSSDVPILNTINNIPPPPPHVVNLPPDLPHVRYFSTQHHNVNNMDTYCSNCTSLNIELSKLTEELHRFKITLGESQVQLAHWKRQYHEKCDLVKEYELEKQINYKHKYEETFAELQDIKSKVFSALSNSSVGSPRSLRKRNVSTNNSEVQNITKLPNIPDIVNMMNGGTGYRSLSRSFKSSEFSANSNGISDKMSISGGGGGSMDAFNYMNPMLNIVGDNAPMSQIYDTHLKHNSNSTEKMLEQLHGERKDDELSTIVGADVDNHNSGGGHGHGDEDGDQFLSQEAENVLYPITNNNIDTGMGMNKVNGSNDHSHSVTSQATTHSVNQKFGNQKFGKYNDVSYNVKHTHHRNYGHIGDRDLNGQRLYVENDDNHNGMLILNANVATENDNLQTMDQYWNGNNMNYNDNNNMNSNVQFAPQFVYDNNQ